MVDIRETRRAIDEAFAMAEQELKLPDGFMRQLLDEDDWSFVIKTYALIEAAMAHLVSDALGDPRLADIIARLSLGNKGTGKVAFASALKLIGTDTSRFIEALSKMRNRLVHDVRNVEFTFAGYIDTLDEKEQMQLAVALSTIDPEKIRGKEHRVVRFLREDGKFFVWLALGRVLSLSFGSAESRRAERKIERLHAEYGRKLLHVEDES